MAVGPREHDPRDRVGAGLLRDALGHVDRRAERPRSVGAARRRDRRRAGLWPHPRWAVPAGQGRVPLWVPQSFGFLRIARPLPRRFTSQARERHLGLVHELVADLAVLGDRHVADQLDAQARALDQEEQLPRVGSASGDPGRRRGRRRPCRRAGSRAPGWSRRSCRSASPPGTSPGPC